MTSRTPPARPASPYRRWLGADAPAAEWPDESAIPDDAADYGTAFGLDVSLAQQAEAAARDLDDAG
jgi:hypothetical protein